MSTPYRPEPACPCGCHERLSHRMWATWVRGWLAFRAGAPCMLRTLLRVALTLGSGLVLMWLVRAGWRYREANYEEERIAELHRTLDWREANEPCRDETTLAGPHAGQPNGARCRKDQAIETHDVGDGTVITCRCASTRKE